MDPSPPPPPPPPTAPPPPPPPPPSSPSPSPSSSPPPPPSDNDDDDFVYLVPYRWLREAFEGGDPEGVRGILYIAAPAPTTYVGPMKIINNLFSSDLVFSLRREDVDDGAVDDGARTYALVRTDLWNHAVKWHSESSLGKAPNDYLIDEDGDHVVYPIMLRISVVQETSTMTAKISKKDNAVELHKRASKIFTFDSEKARIWDFSGQTTLILMNEKNKVHRDGQRSVDPEIIIQLNIYSLLESFICPKEERKDEHGMRLSQKNYCGDPLMINGSIETTECDSFVTRSDGLNGSFRVTGSFGLTGLENLGNTCFMNSAMQCLTHTPKLVGFFLGDYLKEINKNNPLGMNGEIALAFGELLRKLWSSDRTPIAPKVFKSKLARFAPQFSGFNQHDSQELLAFLLDGLHEDLNRVKFKPYVEVKDAADRPHEEVADEYWKNHLARNDSIIVETCQGQYRSTLVCPICSKVSVTFDPFMYLSLPLPSSTMRMMTLTVFSTDGTSKPSPYTISVPKYGKCKDLIQALSEACLLGDDETLLVAEVYSNRILRYLEEPSDSLSLIRDGDRLAAYRLPKESESSRMVVFMHQHIQPSPFSSTASSYPKAFGTPLMARLPTDPKGSSLLNLLSKLLNPFLSLEDGLVEVQHPFQTSEQVAEMDDSSPVTDCEASSFGESGNALDWREVEFYVTDLKGQRMDPKIEMNDGVSISLPESQRHLHILVTWPKRILEKYDISLLSSLPEVHKSGLLPKWPQDSVSLYACLDSFLKEEPLGPEDMWYCPSCKTHQQASKKLDLWRLPEVLVIHLKRFSYSRFLKNKLESFVDFPICDLDLSTYIACKNQRHCNQYELFSISNHYGSMGGGHYTAYVHHPGDNRWYDFDDRHVAPIPEDRVKTSAAYVLFYKRIKSSPVEDA